MAIFRQMHGHWSFFPKPLSFWTANPPNVTIIFLSISYGGYARGQAASPAPSLNLRQRANSPSGRRYGGNYGGSYSFDNGSDSLIDELEAEVHGLRGQVQQARQAHKLQSFVDHDNLQECSQEYWPTYTVPGARVAGPQSPSFSY